jgi:hypothetical protein
MQRRLLGIDARVKNINPPTEWNNYIKHRQTFEFKHMTLIFHKTMSTAVKVINFNKSQSANNRLFHQLCTHLEPANTMLLHSEIYSLSVEMFCVNCLNCNEKCIFFLKDVSSLANFFWRWRMALQAFLLNWHFSEAEWTDSNFARVFWWEYWLDLLST